MTVVGRRRVVWTVITIGVLSSVGLSIFGAFRLADLSARGQARSRLIASQQVLIDKLASTVDAARAQGANVPTPEVVAAAVPEAAVSAPGAQGERGVVGPAGENGADGRPPTATEIADAVTEYCSPLLTGPCRGSQGDPGAAGAAGVDGQSVIGPAGVNGTDGTNGIDGAPGAQGEPGPAGVQGDPGVAGPEGQPSVVPGPQGPPGPPVASFTFTINAHNYNCQATPSDPLALTCTEVVP